ncbi:MAG: NYN domain-containing protein [Proteobacteria bacterium]|nr:NYN domain-containing protein [Pseudomonadota bacterium]
MLNLAPDERFAVFIDGANFHANTKALNFDVDFEKLLSSLKSTGKMVRTYYYTALPDGTEYSTIKRIADWLDYNGYTVVSKPWRDFTNIETGQRRIKGNMDIELALDMMKLSRHVDHAVLFSGDGDFCRLVTEIQDIGVKVTVVSSVKTRPPFLNDGLRRQADHFIELADVYQIFERAPLDHSTSRGEGGNTSNGGGGGEDAGEAQVLHKQRDYTGGGY